MKKWFSRLLFILILSFYLPASAESVFPSDSWVQVESPESVGWSTGKLKIVGDYALSTGTLGLMIIQGGKVVYSYGNVEEQSYLHSVRKSLLSGLIGVFVESGKIDPQSTLESLGIDDSPPALTQPEKQARIIDLLKARSGVYHAAAAETQRMKELRPPRGSHAPGSYWYYNNWDFNVLGVIFEKNTKQSIGKAFFDKIAQPIGMQQFSPNSVDYQKSPDSIHPAYRFKMSTQDIARFGLLYLNHGVWKDKQLIPKKWIIDSTTSYSNASPGVGYGYMWWLPTNVIYGQAIPGVAWRAEGVGGQYIIVIPSMDLVVAHLSKYDSTGIDSYPTFRNLFRLILESRMN
ncbi:MAG TPA: serine hydrolase [Negativicutes bacterium]|nr:serine hydrolase [Negativicutes bacterium]